MAVNNSLVRSQQKVGMTAYLTNDAVKAQINKVIGGKDSAKFISSIISAVQATPALQECDNGSIVSAALLGQSLNLSPSPQLANFYLVPFGDKNKGKVAQFILGWKGMVQLAIRSGYYKRINVLPIKEGELIRFDPLNEEIEVKLIDDEEVREEAPTIGYYASFEYLNGFRKAIYWSKAKMEKHALRYSQGYRSDKKNGTEYTFWSKSFDDMAMKTMIRQLIGRWGIMSTELQTAYTADEAVIKEDGTPEYVETEAVEAPAKNEAKPEEKPKTTKKKAEEPPAGPAEDEEIPFA